MAPTDTWKLQDAKARFSELVRRARAGKPQQVTIHGREAVVVVDPERFEIRAKPPRQERTLADFVERSKKYRGAIDSLKIDRGGIRNLATSVEKSLMGASSTRIRREMAFGQQRRF